MKKKYPLADELEVISDEALKASFQKQLDWLYSELISAAKMGYGSYLFSCANSNDDNLSFLNFPEQRTLVKKHLEEHGYKVRCFHLSRHWVISWANSSQK